LGTHWERNAPKVCGVLFGWFFMVSTFYPLDLRNDTCVALANLWWTISKKWISFALVMVVGMVGSLNGYRSTIAGSSKNNSKNIKKRINY
jgi:hypothetical protein